MSTNSTIIRRTRFIATLGPATDSPETLAKLIEAGVNVFRINMSHAPHDWARELVVRIRTAAKDANSHCAILFDLQGPSIRTGDLDDPYDIKPGDRIEFRQADAAPTLDISTTVNYGELVKDVSAGDTLLVDNGALLTEIVEVSDHAIICEAKSSGPLGNRRHINLPGVRLNLPALTEKDQEDIRLAVECETDFVAGSFVRDAAHVNQLRETLKGLGSSAQIVSKLEDQEAIRNLDSIIEASDVIMVARGDLGIEVHIEELPILQRRIIKRCHELGRRVIVATHMLESMITSPTPTRAEVTDVANAVFEQADAIMLSGETSVGQHPVRCIETLDRVTRRTERSGGLGFGELRVQDNDKQKAIKAAIGLAGSLPHSALLIFTRTGETAHQAALLRPENRIYAFTPNESVCRKLALTRSVTPHAIEFDEKPRITISTAIDFLKKNTDIPEGLPLVIISDTFLEGHNLDSILLEYA